MSLKKIYIYNAKIKNIKDKAPGITNLATNASLNAKLNEVKGEIPIVTNVATDAFLNDKVNEVNGEIPNITNLATATTDLTAFENRITDASNLVKRTDYNTKISEIKIKISENEIITVRDHGK